MIPSISVRVAARYVKAAFFNVGDEILYGKYKNKRGRIISFSENEKGQPLVEIEPVPKGRKQNKIMGLFKIWNVSVIEKAKEASMNSLPMRVASRFILATGVPLGTSWESGAVRGHRFRDHFKITELQNAGKRGKRCRVMSIAPTYAYKGDHDKWMESMSKAIPDYDTYNEIKAFIDDILHDHPGEIRIDEHEVRGVDVNPGGTIKYKFTIGGPEASIEVTAEPKDFSVLHKQSLRKKGPKEPGNDQGGEMYQDTLYWPANKSGAQVFYNWLQVNLPEAKNMTMDGFRKLWHDLKIPYDSH